MEILLAALFGYVVGANFPMLVTLAVCVGFVFLVGVLIFDAIFPAW